jgi:hypothetical protein
MRNEVRRRRDDQPHVTAENGDHRFAAGTENDDLELLHVGARGLRDETRADVIRVAGCGGDRYGDGVDTVLQGGEQLFRVAYRRVGGDRESEILVVKHHHRRVVAMAGRRLARDVIGQERSRGDLVVVRIACALREVRLRDRAAAAGLVHDVHRRFDELPVLHDLLQDARDAIDAAAG